MTDPTKYHIVLSNGTELFNAVYWLDSTSHPFSEVPPMSYDPKTECLLSTEDGYVVIGKNYIVLRELMETYRNRSLLDTIKNKNMNNLLEVRGAA